MTNFKTTSSAFAVALILAGCGGGGSDSAPSVPVATKPEVSVPAPAPVSPPSDLQTSVADLTYPAKSAEHEFITEFNQFRSHLGLGLLSQSAQLDTAARNHLNYVLRNDEYTGGTVDMLGVDQATGRQMFHIERADKPLFTGVQELDRAKAAGYPGSYVGESGTFGGGKGGQVAFAALSSTVYHRAGLMYQSPREVGIAVGQDASQTFVLEFGFVKPQANASDYLGTYPGPGQVGVPLHAGVEVPNPFPELSLTNTDFPTKTGYPISVVVKEGATLEVLKFTLTQEGDAAPIESRLLVKSNDPNRYLAANMAFIVAKAPLKPATNYSVSFSGRVNNVVVNKDWKFSTR